MSASFKAVIFDLDGTLIDSMSLVFQAYVHAVAPYRSPVSDEELRRTMGGPPLRILQQLLTDSTHVTGALRRLETFGADAWKQIQPYPQMSEMLDALQEAGISLGIWTGRERESTEWLLQRHGIASRVQTLVCGDDLPTHKPDPAGLREVLRLLGTSATETIFVGDAEGDLSAGVASGIPTILIRHGITFPDALLTRAWRVVDTPAEAYTLVRAGASKS
jgi:HAD superfamily hydrolase (TIGR01509 family)